MRIKRFKLKQVLSVTLVVMKVLVLSLMTYILLLPFYPELIFKLKYNSEENRGAAQVLAQVDSELSGDDYHLPGSGDILDSNRLIITKIGVNVPIIGGNQADYGLARGAWLVPLGSTPDKGGNTIITGHRFKYLPPSNFTFYLLDKLIPGDIIVVIFNKQKYYYRVRDLKIVDKNDATVNQPSASSSLTLYTCHPIYSTEQRLVVVSELVVE